ncbi:MAG TPA: dTMP kinase [Thermoproteota archaeon]|nr:dTMP kinase [Thermoproteota archaeon]
MRRGKLIAFEGIDGSGKTTISTRAYQAAKNKGAQVLYTFEPTYSKVGSIIHLVLSGDIEASGEFQALMFAADRVNHFQTEIEPELNAGRNVLVDRYIHSSIAYQGVLLNDEEWVRTINRSVPVPDLAIYIDIDPKTGLRRRGRRSIYEKLDLLGEIRAAYKKMVARGELVQVDGSKSEDMVFDQVWKLVVDELRL